MQLVYEGEFKNVGIQNFDIGGVRGSLSHLLPINCI